MAKIHYLVPERSVQTTETFHAIRRTGDGMLYYTKINKNENISIDLDGGNPTDKNGNIQLSTSENYVDDFMMIQPDESQEFTGNGATKAFTLTVPALDITRLLVFVDGIKQMNYSDFMYAPPIVSFKIAPANNSRIVVAKIDKKLKARSNDFYYQYVFEDGDATYFVDSNGYFVKRENFAKSLTRITTDDFSTFESTQTVNATTWRS